MGKFFQALGKSTKNYPSLRLPASLRINRLLKVGDSDSPVSGNPQSWMGAR